MNPDNDILDTILNGVFEAMDLHYESTTGHPPSDYVRGVVAHNQITQKFGEELSSSWYQRHYDIHNNDSEE